VKPYAGEHEGGESANRSASEGKKEMPGQCRALRKFHELRSAGNIALARYHGALRATVILLKFV
jgi:hypothetical protein